MGFVRRRAAYAIAGVSRATVAEVIDAHLETLSMVFLTTIWAVGYGWFEGVIGIGALLGIPGTPNAPVTWYSFLGSLYSSYHLFFGFTVFVITFGMGLLKFNRMLYYRKRYLLFTSLASYPWALTVQDFAYFFFAPGPGLGTHDWTCQALNLGCVVLQNPWKPEIPFIIPRWYGITLAFSFTMFFLAYRSALVNLLVTLQVMKQAGFLEKFHIEQAPPTTGTSPQPLPIIQGPNQEHSVPPPAKVEETKTEQKVTQIVDEEHEKLMRRLRERLERGS